MRKLYVVVLPTIILVAVLVFLACRGQTSLAAFLAPGWTMIWVFHAMFTRDPDEVTIAGLLPTSTAQTPDPTEPWKTLYDNATQMHIETDKGMYQIVTVFVGASLLVLGWVVGARTDQISPDLIAIVGSLAVVLVGIATLLKHRLRYYNKLREVYLRVLERRLCGSLESTAGLHSFMAAASKVPSTRRSAVSFHEAIDIYFVIYAFIWIVVYVWKA